MQVLWGKDSRRLSTDDLWGGDPGQWHLDGEGRGGVSGEVLLCLGLESQESRPWVCTLSREPWCPGSISAAQESLMEGRKRREGGRGH